MSIPVKTYTNKPQGRDDSTRCLRQAMCMWMELPPEDHYPAYAIKAGPGCGKSALAIRVLRQMCLGYFFDLRLLLLVSFLHYMSWFTRFDLSRNRNGASSHKQPHAATRRHLPRSHLQPHAATCSHSQTLTLEPLAATCSQLRQLADWQFEQVAAEVAASGCLSGGCRRLQVTAFSKTKMKHVCSLSG